MLNIYWSAYKNLENEVFDLTKSIHFCDSQIDTFSIRISELILRIGVEVESISKELFNTQFEVGDKVLMGKENDIEIQYCEDGQWIRVNKSDDREIHDLSFDYNCLNYLEEKWMLSERRVLINSSNIYFKQQKHIVLFPLSIDALTKESTMNDRGG